MQTLTSEEILNNSLEHAISLYLKEGESADELLKKFNGNKTELAKFLRDKDYKEWIKTNKKPADISDIEKAIQKVIDKNKADKEKEKELEEKFNKDAIVEEKKSKGLLAMTEKEETTAVVKAPPIASKQKPIVEKKRTWTKSTKKTPPADNSGQASLF